MVSSGARVRQLACVKSTTISTFLSSGITNSTWRSICYCVTCDDLATLHNNRHHPFTASSVILDYTVMEGGTLTGHDGSKTTI